MTNQLTKRFQAPYTDSFAKTIAFNNTFENTNLASHFMDTGSFALLADLVDSEMTDVTQQYETLDICYNINFASASSVNFPEGVDTNDVRVNFTNPKLQITKIHIPEGRRRIYNADLQVLSVINEADIISSCNAMLCIRARGVQLKDLDDPITDVISGKVRIVYSSFLSQANQLISNSHLIPNFYLDPGESLFLYLCYTTNVSAIKNAIHNDIYNKGSAYQDCQYFFTSQNYITKSPVLVSN